MSNGKDIRDLEKACSIKLVKQIRVFSRFRYDLLLFWGRAFTKYKPGSDEFNMVKSHIEDIEIEKPDFWTDDVTINILYDEYIDMYKQDPLTLVTDWTRSNEYDHEVFLCENNHFSHFLLCWCGSTKTPVIRYKHINFTTDKELCENCFRPISNYQDVCYTCYLRPGSKHVLTTYDVHTDERLVYDKQIRRVPIGSVLVYDPKINWLFNIHPDGSVYILKNKTDDIIVNTSKIVTKGYAIENVVFDTFDMYFTVTYKNTRKPTTKLVKEFTYTRKNHPFKSVSKCSLTLKQRDVDFIITRYSKYKKLNPVIVFVQNNKIRFYIHKTFVEFDQCHLRYNRVFNGVLHADFNMHDEFVLSMKSSERIINTFVMLPNTIVYHFSDACYIATQTSKMIYFSVNEPSEINNELKMYVKNTYHGFELSENKLLLTNYFITTGTGDVVTFFLTIYNGQKYIKIPNDKMSYSPQIGYNAYQYPCIKTNISIPCIENQFFVTSKGKRSFITHIHKFQSGWYIVDVEI